jgi:hypothetical protein
VRVNAARVREDRAHGHDIHATVLNHLGFDHLKLTFKFQGRNVRLTDVAGDGWRCEQYDPPTWIWNELREGRLRQGWVPPGTQRVLRRLRSQLRCPDHVVGSGPERSITY